MSLAEPWENSPVSLTTAVRTWPSSAFKHCFEMINPFPDKACTTIATPTVARPVSNRGVARELHQ
jgi:hypothetical protein